MMKNRIAYQLECRIVKRHVRQKLRDVVKQTVDHALRNESLDYVEQLLKGKMKMAARQVVLYVAAHYKSLQLSEQEVAAYVNDYFSRNWERETRDYIARLEQDKLRTLKEISGPEGEVYKQDPPAKAGEYEGQTHYDPDTGITYEWDGKGAWHVDMGGINRLNEVVVNARVPDNGYRNDFRLDGDSFGNLGLGASVLGTAMSFTQEGMLSYRRSLPIERRIGSFSRFRSAYTGLGTASKLVKTGRTVMGMGG